MSVAPPPPRNPPVALAPRRPPTPSEQDENTTAAWAMIAVMFAFKIVTIVMIFVMVAQHESSIPLLVALNWPYLLVGALLLGMIPFGFWYRLVRVRARRRRLQQAEWKVE